MKKILIAAAVTVMLFTGLSAVVYANEEKFETTPMVATGGWADGDGHTVALSSDGHVWAWGYNSCGQLGNGTFNYTTTPSKVIGLSNIEKVFDGPGKSAAIKSDGTVWEWGIDDTIPDDYKIPKEQSPQYIVKPRKLNGLNDVKTLKLFNHLNAAIKNDGSVWVWGEYNNYPDRGYIETPTKIEALTDVIELSEGASFYVLKKDGTVWSWAYGKEPVQIEGLTDIVSIGFNIALKSDGTVWSWGNYIGDGTDSNSDVPVKVMDDAKAIGDGMRKIVIKNDGTVWTWGSNSNGCLGIGVESYEQGKSNMPVEVDNLKNAISVSSSYNSCAAAEADGSVWTWGEYKNGWQGYSGDYYTSPVIIENLNLYADHTQEFTAIYGGANQTGKLEAADAAVIMQKVLNSSYIMPIEYVTDDYLTYLDVDCDGKLTASDATMVMQKVLNNSFVMPIERQ